MSSFKYNYVKHIQWPALNYIFLNRIYTNLFAGLRLFESFLVQFNQIENLFLIFVSSHEPAYSNYLQFKVSARKHR